MIEDVKSLLAGAEHVHQIIGKKWVSLIIHVLNDGLKRFSELNTVIPDLSNVC